jgi:hypothetical protein
MPPLRYLIDSVTQETINIQPDHQCISAANERSVWCGIPLFTASGSKIPQNSFKKTQTAPLTISMLTAVEKSPIHASHWSIDTAF